MENFLPFTDDVMVVLVHKCAQQTHLLALHLETLGYIPRQNKDLNDKWELNEAIIGLENQFLSFCFVFFFEWPNCISLRVSTSGFNVNL